MSKIDYQKLREIAEKTKIAGEAPVMPFDQRINALNDFMKHFSPDIALALLDERERNQQYIKSRDQENEDIALTVGKLRVELEAEEKTSAARLEALDRTHKMFQREQCRAEAAEKRIAELEAREVQLPTRYDLRYGHPINADERHVMIPKENGSWLYLIDLEHALRVAGIRIKGE
ncbi:TPA: ead/Ea22-like family protein [Escherichia coli]|uniref:ead/Ea22-like family protein n=1 Tax=Escherichia coli TaxID=562 RepID=UPI0005AA012D|nr:ead/Ea22-like family protein [Escherichia coli]AXH21092.1 ead/Ea22-like family protein [Escherichia coli]EGI1245311.1 ead/Ea22-like family protein [Escherichia coli]EHA4947118.1 ead/Ea22-like family protein [Escherichia coli]EHS5572476.1 ead/Ea22-like family protein [Escherichia coli]EHS5597112.1 ead/Ea22-like family protein [Escherichia coli]